MSTKKLIENYVYGQVAIGTVPTPISVMGDGRDEITIVNHSTVPIYIGDANVTTTTGVLLAGIVGQTLVIAATAALYGVVATGTATLSYIDCN